MTFSEDSKFESQIKTLIERKFGDLLMWEKPLIRQTVGPFDTTNIDQFEVRRDGMVGEAERVLRRFGATVVNFLHDDDCEGDNERRDQWSACLRREINSLHKRTPIWMDAGFGHPDYQADFEYWGQMEQFDLHEALMLSVGVEPKHYSKQRLERAIKAMERERLIEPIEFLARRYEQFFRKFPSTSFGKLRVSPYFLFGWFNEVELSVHPEFMEALRKRVTKSSGPASLSKDATADEAKVRTDKREVDKIAQLFAAMAVDQLGFDPHAKRSPVPKEIADLAASMGLQVSDDTVRKYLKLGARFIPNDWKPQ